jgi:cobalt-zinc-cadmium efflux system outer membrane protein
MCAEVRQQAAAAAVNLARWTGAAADELSDPGAPAALPEQAFVQLHPAVVTRQRDIDVARQEAAVAASKRRPNWTWEVAYAQRSNFPDLVSVGVSIPLPVAAGERQDRETAARLALVEKGEAELAEALRSAQAEYRTLAGDAARLQQRIRAFDAQVVAPARQRTAVATAAYGANQAALAMVFEAWQAQLDSQRRLLNLQRELARTLVQLNFKPVKAEELP